MLSVNNFPNVLNEAYILLTPNKEYRKIFGDRSRCQMCPFIEETNTFQNKDKNETFDIRKCILSRSSNLIVYLTECKSCSKQYVSSAITPFRTSFNNCKSGARKVSKIYPNKYIVYQEQFYRHFNSEGHKRIEDCKITITDRNENVLELRRRESYRQHSFDTFVPNGLNERFVGIPIIYFTFLLETFIALGT